MVSRGGESGQTFRLFFWQDMTPVLVPNLSLGTRLSTFDDCLVAIPISRWPRPSLIQRMALAPVPLGNNAGQPLGRPASWLR